MHDQIIFFELTKTTWGNLKLARPTPKGDDPWGVFSPLQHTSWKSRIPVIPYDLFERALLKDVMPMMRILGAEPRLFVKRIEKDVGTCKGKLDKSCAFAAEKCHVQYNFPECFDVSYKVETEIRDLMRSLFFCWRENRYFIVVEN